MVNIEIYTKADCPYCHQAKALFIRNKLFFQEISIDDDIDLRENMIKRSGRTTVPQIFIDGKHLGGCDDLHVFATRGGLELLLK